MRTARGFSLIEMAFVLVIITLLLGGLLVPFATQVEQRRIAETNKALEEIKEALIGYALSHSSTTAPSQPYLPCPDVNGDGAEDRDTATGNCTLDEGEYPWVDLGTTPSDAWGNRFHYRVISSFSNSQNGFSLTPPVTGITICNKAPIPGPPASCPASNRVATTIPAVVLSYGKNGYGALNGNTAATISPLTPPKNPSNLARDDELANIDADTIFVSRIITASGTPATEFDDIVIWLSPNVLYNRMVAAGKLP